MEIKKTWTSSPKEEMYMENKELDYLADRWDLDVKISISNPHYISHNCLDTDFISDKQQDFSSK